MPWPRLGFAVEHADTAGYPRYDEPDFGDVYVAHKDRAAMIWCENASLLTDTAWEYRKVPQREFERLQPTEYADLLALG